MSLCVLANLALCLAVTAPAMAGLGQPTDGQIGLQDAGSPVMEHITQLYDMVNYTIIAIALFVLALLIYVMVRFNETANPTPSRTTHNTLVEVAWTIIPILILVTMSIPSFKLLYEEYSFPKPDLTIKATAMQWSWDHEYMDQDFTISSNVLRDEDVLKAKIGDKGFSEKYGKLAGLEKVKAVHADAGPVWQEMKKPRLLTVDQEIAVPVGKVVHLLITSNDVIHQWGVPSLGVKQQAVPGRTAAAWFRIDKAGTYYGDCYVLCGKAHSAMPIVVRAVEPQVYEEWQKAAKAKDMKKAKSILTSDAERSSQQALAQAP